MKTLKDIIREEFESFMSQQNTTDMWDQSEPIIARWEDVVPSGTEKVAIVKEPEKIKKFINIAKASAQRPPVFGKFNNDTVRLNIPLPSKIAKFRIHIKDKNGIVREFHVGEISHE